MTSDNSLDAVKRLMQARIYQWSHRQESQRARSGPVVTISREPGCGGESVAERLSTELELHLYHWEIVEQIARDEHVSTQVVLTLDEKTRSELEDWRVGPGHLSSDAYLWDLKRILFAIASHGSAVIVGRGSNFYLPPEKRIGLCLVAPLDVRIRNVMEEQGFSEKRAREHIVELETEHRKLVKKYFDADIHDPTHYHLVVNTALVSPESIVRIVKGIIEDQTSSPGPIP